ncbi:MAG: hypothetical protein AAFY88_06180 [Acidobacteriota bacterium]
MPKPLDVTPLLLALLIAAPAFAQAYLPTETPAALLAKEKTLDMATPDPVTRKLSQLAPEAAQRHRELLFDVDGSPVDLLVDVRSGRVNSLWLSRPLVPGPGVDNDLAWTGFAEAPDGDVLDGVIIDGMRAFLTQHREALGADPKEMHFNVGAHGDVIQVHARRVVDGVPVRGAGLTATINHGNLVLLGFDHWADLDVSTLPSISEGEAYAALLDYLAPVRPEAATAAPDLELVPLADSGGLGGGYSHRLAWVIPVDFDGVVAGYRAVVDAHSGEVLEFKDSYHGQDVRNIKGGVYPLSNDGIGDDGVEVAGFPMPFADVTHGGGTATADSGGNVFDVSGPMTTALSGPYVTVDDFCGEVSESSAEGDLDLGTSGGIDCDTPPGSSLGNTHSARTTFYEVNRIAEAARGQLPGNAWVRAPLTAELNISVVCNAFWTGSVIQFFRSSPTCSNLGELAGVIDHEWGHGMDDNGTNGSVSSPAEGIADVFAALRINDSCPGRGALPSTCSGFGDPCTPSFGCTGVRDIDWMRHDSQQPHNVAWANANCASQHCRGMLNSEAVWDLAKRDLPARYGYDSNVSLEIATRLTYLGADNVASWFSTSNGEMGGCAASSGYQQYLAADDDNGDLTDGTPHMQAIFDAFDRHGIACDTPVVQDSGCDGKPTLAPTVTAGGTDLGATLSWSSVPGASRYKIYRTDGVRQCDYGKALVGETSSTSFADSGLQNDREYYYIVAGFTGSDACMGPASPCVTVTAGGEVAEIFADGFESGDTTAWSASSK